MGVSGALFHPYRRSHCCGFERVRRKQAHAARVATGVWEGFDGVLNFKEVAAGTK